MLGSPCNSVSQKTIKGIKRPNNIGMLSTTQFPVESPLKTPKTLIIFKFSKIFSFFCIFVQISEQEPVVTSLGPAGHFLSFLLFCHLASFCFVLFSAFSLFPCFISSSSSSVKLYLSGLTCSWRRHKDIQGL